MSNENTIKLEIVVNNTQDRIKYYTDNEKFYSSPEYYKAYSNWRKSKIGDSDDLLLDLATSAVKSGFDAIRHTFGKTFNKAIEKQAHEAVKQAVKNNPNMILTD